MNNQYRVCLLICLLLGVSCNAPGSKTEEVTELIDSKNDTISGDWLRISQNGPVRFNFSNQGIVEGDIGNDGLVEVLSNYEIRSDTLVISDKEGMTCPESGTYSISRSPYYMSLNLLSDNCDGRIKSTMGFWVRPGFKELIEELDKKIKKTPQANLYLDRGRMYLALGNSKKARNDFDKFLEADSTDSRAYINRAATRFPNDMRGVVADCNEAIAIDANDKNAYFLLGLALYELGEYRAACEAFEKAIELGFEILRTAEAGKCKVYWD